MARIQRTLLSKCAGQPAPGCSPTRQASHTPPGLCHCPPERLYQRRVATKLFFSQKEHRLLIRDMQKRPTYCFLRNLVQYCDGELRRRCVWLRHMRARAALSSRSGRRVARGRSRAPTWAAGLLLSWLDTALTSSRPGAASRARAYSSACQAQARALTAKPCPLADCKCAVFSSSA